MTVIEECERPQDGAGIQVCVRVRPLNTQERNSGARSCVSFDDATRQIVLSAVDRSTLMQLRGLPGKGFAFDRRYGPDATSDKIYDDCVSQLVDHLFKGYSATVLAYGQTGSGKTLTMSGGTGTRGVSESGIIRRAVEHVLAQSQVLRQRLGPGESICVRAQAVELYNEELRDLGGGGGSSGANGGDAALRIAERPAGRDGRMIPEVAGAATIEVRDAESLLAFFTRASEARAVGATRMNDRSSRSHAIYSILLQRTLVDVVAAGSGDKVRTTRIDSRLHLVDLAGSERIKRSGATGTALREAAHINGGLLALGNVIVALTGGQAAGDETGGGNGCSNTTSSSSSVSVDGAATRRQHIPYRDSKLTRLLQDGLGGGGLTVVIACVSACEHDFEETTSTLTYANRACRIRNSPLAHRSLLLEEDLLPLLPPGASAGPGPGAGGISMAQMQALLEDHARMREARERRGAEKRDKEERRAAELRALKDAEGKAPAGFQRLRMAQYDELRKRATAVGGTSCSLMRGEVIRDETIPGFKRRDGDADGNAGSGGAMPEEGGKQPGYMRGTVTRAGSPAAGAGSHSRPASATLPRPSSAATRMAASTVVHSPRGGSATAPSPRGSSTCTATRSTRGSCDTSATAAGAAVAAARQAKLLSAAAAAAVAAATAGDAASLGSCHPSSAVHDGIAAAYSLEGLQPDLQRDKQQSTAQQHSAQHGRLLQQQQQQQQQQLAASGLNQYMVDGSTRAAALAVLEFSAQGSNAGSGVYGGHSQPEANQPALQQQQQQYPCAQQQQPLPPPQLLARFRVNSRDTMSVFRAVSPEDLADVAALLPPGTTLPGAGRMTYLVARLELAPFSSDALLAALDTVAAGAACMTDTVGPAVGCLMATFGTTLIPSTIFEFEDPPELMDVPASQRLELWGLQIPHTSARPALTVNGAAAAAAAADLSSGTSSSIVEQAACWSSTDRLNVSVGLLYALCSLAKEVGAAAGLCVPRPQLLRRWLQAGVRMCQVPPPIQLVYPEDAHDHAYYRASTVAYFMVDEVAESLRHVLSSRG